MEGVSLNESDIDYQKYFRDNLKSFRLNQGLTQSQLSSRAHYDATYVGKLERGESAPSMATVIRIGRALDIQPFELLRPPRSHLDIREEIPAEELADLPFNPLDIQIFDSLPFTMGLVTEQGTLVYVNDAFVDLTGIDRDDIKEQKLWELPMWHFEGKSQQQLVEAISGLHEIEDFVHYGIQLQTDAENSIDLFLYPTPRKRAEADKLMLIFELRRIDHDKIDFPMHIKHYHRIPEEEEEDPQSQTNSQ